tara:strand:+ start:46425 stop:47540 length:1116 start_codon:yes stop_codon:yes gene_type:complete
MKLGLHALAALAMCSAAACGDAADPCATREPGAVCMVAGTGEHGYNNDGHSPETSDLYLVSQARRGPDSLLYLMDFNNHRLRVVDENGAMQTVAGNGFHGGAFPGALATDSALENPIDFDFLPDGRVVLLSYHDPRIVLVTSEGTLEVIAGNGELGEVGNEGDGSHPLLARFIQPDGIAIGPDGAIYVSDSLANRIRVIRGNGIETFAGNGEAGYSGDGGDARDAALHWPSALDIAPDGALYVTDSSNHAVRRISPDGTIETIAGTGTKGFAGDGDQASEAKLDFPNGIDVADDGTVYIADRNNFRVRRIDSEGRIETIAGSGEKGFAGDGGPALEADFGFIARITLDGDSLLIADQSNSCVRRLLLSEHF